MIHKRPFIGEGVYEPACKHPRHWDNTDHLAPVADAVPTGSCYLKPFASGDGCSGKTQDDGSFRDENVNKTSSEPINEFEAGSSGCRSHSWWDDSEIFGCDLHLNTTVNLAFFPDFFAPTGQFRVFVGSNEICSSPLQSSSPRLVSVGPEYQADIPEWDQCRSTSGHVYELHEQGLMGTCVIPMSHFEAFPDKHCYGGECKVECDCSDRGSVSCIRQHIMEARENLKRNLGDNIFEALGFGDMGEGVSDKWTEEEERAFYEIVHSNPATMGKNFWDQLSEAFPCRSKKDLVSYYFNVFMLRIRMEQNHFYPSNIDSDDDEWQRTEDRFVEEDEGSGLESLTSQDGAACQENEDDGEFNTHKDLDHLVLDEIATDEEDIGGVEDTIGDQPQAFVPKCDGDNKPVCKKACDVGDDYDNQNDSCTSYENEEDNTDKRQAGDE